MRVHIVGVPRNPSTPNIAVDPYARASYWLTTLLYREGVEVYYYGYVESNVECTRKFNIVDNSFHKQYFISNFETNHWVTSDEADLTFVNNALYLLQDTVIEGDIVVGMWSNYIPQLKSIQSLGAKVVDGHIGHLSYMGADYNVFTSTANQHFIYGKFGDQTKWNDTVISPPCNSILEFDYQEKKEDYILYIARLIESKGIRIFLDIAKAFPNKKFLIAGQGNLNDICVNLPSNVEYVGYAHLEKRKQLLSKAQAVVSPTHYIEPFGLTTIEANLSGTPVITTDWGGYVDNVIHGVTGFRCSYFSDFVNAINNLNKIDPKNCRKFGEQFTAETSVKKYINYFYKISKSNWYEY
jgi:glycosyltransferase involved in cell wall biosynthesis